MQSEAPGTLRLVLASYLLFAGKCADDVRRFAHSAGESPSVRRMEEAYEPYRAPTHVDDALPVIRAAEGIVTSGSDGSFQPSQISEPAATYTMTSRQVDDVPDLRINYTLSPPNQTAARAAFLDRLDGVLHGDSSAEIDIDDIYLPLHSGTYFDKKKMIKLLDDTAAKASKGSLESALAKKASNLLKNGKPGAADRCASLAWIKKRSGTPEDTQAARQLKRAANVLRMEEDARRETTKLLIHLPKEKREIFETFEEFSARQPWIKVVQVDVKRFVDDFRSGASDHERFLADIEGNDRALLAEWNATPVAKRVFIAGSGQDKETVGRVRTKLKKKGFTVFFYKFCANCSNEVVGAFFATAGHAIVSATEHTPGSPYTSPEVAMAQHFWAGGRQMVMLTPVDVLNAAEYGTGAAGLLFSITEAVDD